MAGTGKKIREIRLKRNLSQEDLADAAKVNLRTIQRIENNETTPRRKTLQLIFNALEVEVIEIEKEETKAVNKYLIWSVFLTLLIIIGTFVSWFEFASEYGADFEKNGAIKYAPNGWIGNINISFMPINFYNWLVSICSLSIGGIVISNSIGLIKTKIFYVIGQLLYISVYLFVLISLSNLFIKESKHFSFKPGLFIVITATILLTISYLKKIFTK